MAQSLVTVDQRGGRSWYGLLATVRSFARSQLSARGQLEPTQDRWADSLVVTAENLVRAGTQAGTVDAWVTIHAVADDLLAGLRWCLDHDASPARAGTLFTPLWWVVYNARAESVAELGDRLLACWPDASADLAPVAAITGFAHVVLGALDDGARLAEQSLDAAVEAFPAVVARRALTVHAHATGRDAEALRWAEEAVTASEEGKLPAWHNELLTLRAFLLAAVGRTGDAVVQAAEARDSAVQLDSPIVHAWAVLAYGCLVAVDDRAAGRAVLEPLVERCHAMGYPLGAGRSLRALGRSRSWRARRPRRPPGSARRSRCWSRSVTSPRSVPRAYERRIIDLQEDLAEAEDHNDRGRAERSQTELDLLVDQLAGARGLGGRARHTGGTAERARSAVTWRIRSSIKRIAGVHPELGRHLAASVRTGGSCAYQPETPVRWLL